MSAVSAVSAIGAVSAGGTADRRDSELLVGAGPADRHGRLAPAPEVLLAIALAVEECWPRPSSAKQAGHPWNRPTPRWRFSGRWWSRPPVLRRERPIG